MHVIVSTPGLLPKEPPTHHHHCRRYLSPFLDHPIFQVGLSIPYKTNQSKQALNVKLGISTLRWDVNF